MAINNNLYPPIVKTYMPAFVTDGLADVTTCRVYFSLSPYNKSTDIANVQVTIRDQNSNKSMLKKADYPSAVKITSLQEDTSRTVDRFYIEIPEQDIQGGWKNNLYYRVQLRFTDMFAEAIEPGTKGLDTWLSANYEHFSEWSSVCLVRAISTPTLEISGFDLVSNTVVWSLANSQIIGKLKFADENETDILKQYQIKLYDTITDESLHESGIQYSNNYNDVNAFVYNLPYSLELDKEYYFTVEYLTMSNYSKIDTFNFAAIQSEEVPDSEMTLTVNPDNENGRMEIAIKRVATATSFIGTVVIRRSSSETNFTIWEDLKYYTYNEAVTALKETWYDMTIESDVWYKYCVQLIDVNQRRGRMKILKSPVLSSFEYMFLTVKDRQLKIKLNPAVSSFKRIVQESRTDTLGSLYPFIRRNGSVNYAQFPIGGLISFFMDEEELFTSREKLFGKQLNSYANFNDANSIDNYNNYSYEKKFRDEVIKFLYDGKAKLFRSPTEGNFVVKIMDISLTPNAQLSRYVWSFSGTAYEIANTSTECLQELGILEGLDR